MSEAVDIDEFNRQYQIAAAPRIEREQAWMTCPDCEVMSLHTAYELAKRRGCIRGNVAYMKEAWPDYEPMTEHAGIVKRCAAHAEVANG